MIGVVISLNIAIALFCLSVAWRVWRLRRMLAKVADTLLGWEYNTHHTLYAAPKYIFLGQERIAHLRRQHAQLRLRLQQVQQVLALIFLLQRLFRQQGQWLHQHSPRHALKHSLSPNPKDS